MIKKNKENEKSFVDDSDKNEKKKSDEALKKDNKKEEIQENKLLDYEKEILKLKEEKLRILICCSLPVALSLAETFTMPFASISNVTSI